MTSSEKADLAVNAKALGVNLSESLEMRFSQLSPSAERQCWLADNAAATDSYDERIDEGTILSDFDLPF